MRTLRTVSVLACTFLCCTVLAPGSAHAHVQRIEIESTQTDAANGLAPAYTTVRGRAFGELDPDETENRIIQDTQFAPRNARGNVEYVTDFMLSFPTDRAESSGVLVFDAANRGTPIADLALSVPRPDGSGKSFFSERKLIVLRSAWQPDAPRTPLRFGDIELPRLRIDVPIAKQRNGSPILGPVRSEIIVNERGRHSSHLGGQFADGHLTYPPAIADDPAAVLTRRRKESDPRVPVPRAQWRFADCSSAVFPGVPSSTHVCVRNGFDPDFIYELVYTAKDPLVLGIGFAATRDVVAFFRYSDKDSSGMPNPVRGSVKYALALGVSQSGNFVKTFLHLGFNRDAEGRRIFDAAMPVVASRTNALNIRFGQPGRGAGQHEDHLYPGHTAPSSWGASQDQIAGRRAGLLDRCTQTNTCARIMQVLTSSEYWQLQGSPTHTDAIGKEDLSLPSNVRLYLVASTQHTPAHIPVSGICTQLNNPSPTRETLRALFSSVVDWARDAREPPESVYPTLRAQELVSPLRLAWPNIPGAPYTALVNRLPLLDFGPQFRAIDESGIIATEPPRIGVKEYTILVPQVDGDGNELGGIRTTTTAAPLGTYTGWNYRKAGYSAGELCSLNGSYIPFQKTRAGRIAAGDPRPSLEERYGDHEGYVGAVRKAAARLVSAGFLLSEDEQRLVREAEASDVLR